ncbi:MAG: hypothetical protein JWP52_4655 [Rhizobacter sp.]|nr:hypothetical protein [Rhizobacter sp.]
MSQALTNTTRHARASCARVSIEERNGLLHLSIRDDASAAPIPHEAQA